jgi:hypothetical protein
LTVHDDPFNLFYLNFVGYKSTGWFEVRLYIGKSLLQQVNKLRRTHYHPCFLQYSDSSFNYLHHIPLLIQSKTIIESP